MRAPETGPKVPRGPAEGPTSSVLRGGPVEAVPDVPVEKHRNQQEQRQFPPLERPVALARLIGDDLVVAPADPGHAVVHPLLHRFRDRAGRTERILEPFQRLARPQMQGGSSGLGLAIVRAVADSHEADLRVVPNPVGGLTVTVVFAVA